MTDRAWMWLRRNGVNAVIGALAIATAIELAAGNVSAKDRLVPLSIFFVLPLMARTRFPLLAPALCLAALVVGASLDPTAFDNVATPLFDALAATVALGAIPDRRRYLGWFLALLAATAVNLIQPDRHWSDELWLAFFFSSAWVVGYAISTRTLQTRELRERAERAERERERLAHDAVAEERARIARELHDVVAHSVSVMVVQSAGVRRLLQPEQEREREALMVVERIGREALTEMRRMLGVLRTSTDGAERAPQPGLRNVEKLVEQAERAGLSVDLEVQGEPVQLPPGLDLSAYRILQEGLTNALKHGDRGAAQVRVRYAPESLELEVVDDGTASSGAENGYGLEGMRERVAVYGGELEAGPRDEGGGYRVRARLPISGAPGA